MPRGHKSKNRSRAKRQQARGEAQSLRDAQVTTAEVEDGSPPSSPVGVPQESQGAPPSSPLDTGVSSTTSEVAAENPAAGAGEEGSSASGAATPAPRARRDPLVRKTSLLLQFLLEKFKAKEPVTEEDMLKAINKKYKEYFPLIFKRSTERLELVFGIELKKVNRSTPSYTLVSKLGMGSEGSLRSSSGLPKTGLLMTLLGVIFMKGNRATEEEIWEFLNVLGIYPGRRHLIFGEPRKLITKDLVQEKYLEYRQVPGSDPPSYEFLWGSRARAETSKMKVLEVLAKFSDTIPSCFPNLYDEALKEEAERARENAVGGAGALVRPRAGYRALSHSSSHI